MDRRDFLRVLGASAGVAAVGVSGGSALAAGADRARRTGSLSSSELPNRLAKAGTDLIPQIEHVVVVMLENHSYDNILGMSGRGDGFTLDKNGLPTNSNPNGRGGHLRAFHMPTPCQLSGQPSQSWDASHEQFDGGTNQGFVTSASGDVAMGYWTPSDMPFTNSLATVFPVADRWFASVLAQTIPNRRYLMAGTSLGLINDKLPSELPPHGTMFNQFERHGISWRNYYSDLPSLGAWFGLVKNKWVTSRLTNIDHFFTDCASGSLPQFSLVDPKFSKSGEENPEDIQFGEVFLSQVVHAVMASPKWRKTLLVWAYDEHGGYYDHVPPPRAPKPDAVPPALQPGEPWGTFGRYGFRVPAGVVSAYAKPDFVSHTVYDHTSMLKFIHQKWNLPSLTDRDHAANSLGDMLDLTATPAFATPPKLARPVNPAGRDSCLRTGAGPIP